MPGGGAAISISESPEDTVGRIIALATRRESPAFGTDGMGGVLGGGEEGAGGGGGKIVIDEVVGAEMDGVVFVGVISFPVIEDDFIGNYSTVLGGPIRSEIGVVRSEGGIGVEFEAEIFSHPTMSIG